MNHQKKTKNELIKELEELHKHLDELKSAQSLLNHAEDKYRSVFEKSGAPAIIIESDMTITMANPKFEELIGFSKEEIEGKFKWPQFMVEEDRERMKQYHIMRRTEGCSAPDEYECKIVNRKGEVRNIFMKVGMIPGPKTSIASFTDITSWKRAEAALRESERRLSTLMGNLPGMAYRCRNDEKWTMEFLSQGCLELTGFSPSDLIEGGSYAYGALIHPDDRESVQKTIRESLMGREAYEMVYRIKTAQKKEKWVWEKGVGVFSPEGELIALEGFISDFTDQKEAEQVLLRENIRLKSSMKDRYQLGNIIGKSKPMQEVYKLIIKAAASDANVIIYGESGTGKELAARAIHDMSDRSRQNFVPVNCGAIPENLFESEFFGYEKGAFSGADKTRSGYLDIADRGTLFLDELGEIAQNMQVKLLRAIEGGGYTPLGGNALKKTDIRIVAATNRNLKSLVKKGQMREDFFYRIHIIPIYLPPLRERKEDIPLLIDHFMIQCSPKNRKLPISGNIMDALNNYDWPGNVRELQNVLHRYTTLGKLDFIESRSSETREINPVPDVENLENETADMKTSMENFEKRLIIRTLEKHRWHREDAARSLGIPRRTFFRKLKKHNLIKA